MQLEICYVNVSYLSDLSPFYKEVKKDLPPAQRYGDIGNVLYMASTDKLVDLFIPSPQLILFV